VSKKATPVRVAVIGSGNMGRHHVRVYAALDAAELVAVADPNPATRALAEQYNCHHFTRYVDMLDQVHPDAVSVSVPTHLHAEISAEVMSRGIHCLVEKPIASTIAEANALIALAESRRLVFTVGHVERYNPVVRKLHSLIQEGKLGEITAIVAKRVGGLPAVETKTDVVLDLAVHDIEIMSFLLDRYPDQVFAHSSRTLHSSEVDAAELLLDFGAASGFVQANWTTPVKIRTIAVTGTAGYVEGNYVTQELNYYEHNMSKLKGEYIAEVAQLAASQLQSIQVDFREPLEVELSMFVATIQGHVRERLVSPQDAREALRIGLAALPRKKAQRTTV